MHYPQLFDWRNGIFRISYISLLWQIELNTKSLSMQMKKLNEIYFAWFQMIFIISLMCLRWFKSSQGDLDIEFREINTTNKMWDISRYICSSLQMMSSQLFPGGSMNISIEFQERSLTIDNFMYAIMSEITISVSWNKENQFIRSCRILRLISRKLQKR